MSERTKDTPTYDLPLEAPLSEQFFTAALEAEERGDWPRAFYLGIQSAEALLEERADEVGLQTDENHPGTQTN